MHLVGFTIETILSLLQVYKKMGKDTNSQSKQGLFAFLLYIYICICIYIPTHTKVKQSHYKPRGFQEVEVPRFQDNQHMKVVKLSALCSGRLYPQEMFLVLISVRG